MPHKPMISSLPEAYTWRVTGASIQGAAHVREGLPNQDRILWQPRAFDSHLPAFLLAVADGHGSPRSFRSGRGAGFAVSAAAAICTGIFLHQNEFSNPAMVEEVLLERMPRDLVYHWRRRVERDLQKYPFLETEEEKLYRQQGSYALKILKQNPFLAYGTTLIVVLVTTAFTGFIQLGDGDIVVVLEDGQTLRPLPPDPRLTGNQTTSLCVESAWRDFRTAYQMLDRVAPAMIMISTDGYINSFANEEGFFKASLDYFKMLRGGQEETIRKNLRRWLRATSAQGSGDDISLGLAWRVATDGVS